MTLETRIMRIFHPKNYEYWYWLLSYRRLKSGHLWDTVHRSRYKNYWN